MCTKTVPVCFQLQRLSSGSVREPPSHLRPGRQHVQKHDDRPREPVRHHQVRAAQRSGVGGAGAGFLHLAEFSPNLRQVLGKKPAVVISFL